MSLDFTREDTVVWNDKDNPDSPYWEDNDEGGRSLVHDVWVLGDAIIWGSLTVGGPVFNQKHAERLLQWHALEPVVTEADGSPMKLNIVDLAPWFGIRTNASAKTAAEFKAKLQRLKDATKHRRPQEDPAQ